MGCNAMAFFPSNFMLQSNGDNDQAPNAAISSIVSSCTPQDFHGMASMMGKRSMSFSGLEICEEMNCEDDLSDDCSQAGEKKRRLNMEQVKTLEKNFELGNKLEPERKMQLARALGLQPRQIAIWFQNRRARWKTKQLEKDYDLLKRQFEAVKADNELLQAQNKKLQAEILALKKSKESEPINLNKENTEGSCSIKSENSSDLNLDISKPITTESPISPNSQRNFFHSMRPANVTSHLLHGSSRLDLQCPKLVGNSGNGSMDEGSSGAQEEPFLNMFCPIDESSAFWPWTDHCTSSFH